MSTFLRRALALLSLLLLIGLQFTSATHTEAQESEAAAEAKEVEAPSFPAHLANSTLGVEELTYLLVPLTKEELQGLSTEWLKIVKAKTREVADLQVKILKAKDDEAESLRGRLTEAVDERKDLFTKYSMVVDSLEKKGGDEALIAELRAYENSVMIEETRTADAKTLAAKAISWLTDEDGGVELAKDVSIIIISLLGLLIVARIIRRVSRGWIGRVPNLSKLLQAFLVTVIYWLVIAVGLMIVLSALGIDISPVFALIGGASFILAFAFQDTLGNLASGLMIMINRPFDEGDYVDIGGVAGTVNAVSIVATTVTTPDNQVIVVPNKNVWGSVITNVTTSETRRVDLIFGISYEDSIADAMDVMEKTVRSHSLVLDDPEPVIEVSELGDNSVNFVCRPWVKTDDYWTVYWDLTRQMKEAFDAAGISIPFPQRDIHLNTGATIANKIESGSAQALPE